MNNKVRLSLVIISTVFLSACTTKVPTGIQEQASDNKTPETQSEQSLSTSLRDLLAMGKSQQCTVSSSSVNDKNVKTDTTGTIYISGKKMAQEV
jgi:starvation-inducible outer membrane lipoprotein